LVIGAAWLFGGIAEDVVTGDPLTLVDKQLAIWFYNHTTPALNRTMIAITALGSMPAISGLALLTFLSCCGSALGIGSWPFS
jgi:hypothetical protein